MDAKSIGNTIAELRKKNGFTQTDLAQKLGISSKTVSKWENGNGYLDIVFFPKLASLFGVSIDQIKKTPCGDVYDHNTEFSGFLLLINNTPIMCKGANWVPCEPFPGAEGKDKITTLLTLAKTAGVNMIRVWGGGIFEQQYFYNECDRLGILITQYFLMACVHYPEDDTAFIEQLKKETEFAAYALRNHPSLVWWSGDNENAILGYDDAQDYQGRAAIHKGIMPILMKLNPRRRFMLSSPCGGKNYASKTAGTTHNTQFLGKSIFPYIKDTDMLDYKEHFKKLLARIGRLVYR